MVYTSTEAKVYRLGVRAHAAHAAEDQFPDELNPAAVPAFLVAATVQFDDEYQPVCGVAIEGGLLAVVHTDHARLYQLPAPQTAALSPVAEESEAAESDALQPWVATASVNLRGLAGEGDGQDEQDGGNTGREGGSAPPAPPPPQLRGIVDFVTAPVAGSVVGGGQRTDIVGILLRWEDSPVLRRYELPVLGMSLPASGTLAAKFEWACSSVITASVMDPAGTLYATGHADGGVAVWDVRLAALHCMLPAHKASVTALAFGCNPFVVSVCGGDQPRLHVSSVEDGTCIGIVDGAVSCHVLPHRREVLCAIPQDSAAHRLGVVELQTASLLGCLHVEVDFSHLLPGSLLVEVVSAVDLANTDEVGASDPYCQVSLGGVSRKTPVVKDQLNPEFEACLELPLLNVNKGLQLEIFDDDASGDDDNLAYGSVDILSLVPQLAPTEAPPLPTRNDFNQVRWIAETVWLLHS